MQTLSLNGEWLEYHRLRRRNSGITDGNGNRQRLTFDPSGRVSRIRELRAREGGRVL